MATTEPSVFGAWLRHHRKIAGLTQEELASRAGMTARGIAALERGRRRRPYPHTVRAIAAALAVPAEDLAGILAMLESDSNEAAPPQTRALPLPAVALVGRDSLLAEVGEVIGKHNTRLVTLIGPGGVGKTSLALELARQVGCALPGGALVFLLEALDDPGGLLAWIATRLGLSGVVAGSEAEALQGYFGARRVLLVLDNFEHLLPAAPTVARLLAANPGLQVLVTSRAPLRLRDEWEVQVEPLAVPNLETVPTPQEIATSDAVQLFVERARAISPSFVVNQANANAIAAICRRLDGLPLALELAAARLRVMSPTELLARLDQVLPVLVGGSRDLPERQRTMRQTIDWSYRILGPGERALFRRLSLCVGGWDLEASEAIGRDLELEGASWLDVLAGLVEHSLIVVEPAGEHGTRYRMLETIRQFGCDELDAHNEVESAARSHAAWYLTLAERAAAHDYGPDEDTWLDRLESDHPNFRLAISHALEVGDETLLLRLVAALGRLWLRREYIGDGIPWREASLRAVRAGEPNPIGATVLFNIARLAWERGEQESGIALMRESLAHWTALGDGRGLCGAMVILANMLRLTGEPTEADALLGEASDLLAQRDDTPFWCSMALRLRGIRALERDEVAAAEALLITSLEMARRSGHQWSVASALHNLGDAVHRRGDDERALRVFGESLDLSFKQRDRWAIAVTLPPVAEILAALGEFSAAARLLGASRSLGEAISARLVLTVPVDDRQERVIAGLQVALGEREFNGAWEAGYRLTVGEAIDEVRRVIAVRRSSGLPNRVGLHPFGLTGREVEVIRLVVGGMTNAEVAGELYLSRRTVDAHLRRIYDKLDLGSRLDLIRFARERGLVDDSRAGTR